MWSDPDFSIFRPVQHSNEEHRYNEAIKEAELQNDRIIQDYLKDRRQLWAEFIRVNNKKAFSILFIAVKKSRRRSFVWADLIISATVNCQRWWTVKS